MFRVVALVDSTTSSVWRAEVPMSYLFDRVASNLFGQVELVSMLFQGGDH
jgi:hypothetical protein